MDMVLRRNKSALQGQLTEADTPASFRFRSFAALLATGIGRDGFRSIFAGRASPAKLRQASSCNVAVQVFDTVKLSSVAELVPCSQSTGTWGNLKKDSRSHPHRLCTALALMSHSP